jgi:hypothetical protein
MLLLVFREESEKLILALPTDSLEDPDLEILNKTRNRYSQVPWSVLRNEAFILAE